MNPQVLPYDVLNNAQRVTLTRGSTSVWDTGDHTSSQPPLVLLHGWNIDAPTNFGFAVPELARTRRVVMFDHHGHGHGVRPDEPFILATAAADVIEVLDSLNIATATIAGYSMGGAIAQLVARDHPDRCAGVVLMATAGVFAEARRERAMFAAIDVGARALRRLPELATSVVFDRVSAKGCRNYPGWVLDTVRSADPVSLLEAGAELGRFNSSPWLRGIRSPTAVIITSDDSVVSPRRQVDLAAQVRAVHVETVAADHDLPIRNDARFALAIDRAVEALRAASARNDHRVHAAH